VIGLGGQLPRNACSRAGCTATAAWALEWSNPQIHTEGRTKTWLACADHVDFLREFLAARSFPLQVQALTDAREEPTG
jgi:hypothetical protein